MDINEAIERLQQFKSEGQNSIVIQWWTKDDVEDFVSSPITDLQWNGLADHIDCSLELDDLDSQIKRLVDTAIEDEGLESYERFTNWKEGTETGADKFLDGCIYNNLDKDAPFGGKMFYPMEKAMVLLKEMEVKGRVATYCNGVDGSYIIRGLSYADRLGYFITMEPITADFEIKVD